MNQHQAIVYYIKRNGSITHNEAMFHLGIKSFNRRMTDLKNKGYEFSSEWIVVWSRYGNGTAKVLRYRITKQPKRKAK